MESQEATPPKIRRMQKTVNLHVSECVRQFKLPQQFPSTVVGHKPVAREHSLDSPKILKNVSEIPLVSSNKPRNTQKISIPTRVRSMQRVLQHPDEKIIRVSSPLNSNERRIVHKTTSAPKFSNGLKLIQKSHSSHLLSNVRINPVFSTKGEPPNKFQKLKLKSPDGKDLGEFQVKLLGQQNDSLKRKLISIPKQIPINDESQGSAVVSSTQNESIISYSINDLQYPGMIYQEPRINRILNETNTKPNKFSTKSATGAPIGQIVKNSKSKVISIKKSQLLTGTNRPGIKLNTERVIMSSKDDGSTSTNNSSNLNAKKVLYLKPEDHPYLKNITQSGKPISLKPLTLKSLAFHKSEPRGQSSPEASKLMGTGELPGFQNGDFDEELEDREIRNVYNMENVEINEMHSGQQKQHQLEESSSKERKHMTVMPNRIGAEFSNQSYSGSSSDMGSLQYSDEEDELGTSDTVDTDDSIDQGLMQRNKLSENEEQSVVRNNVHNMITQRNFEKRSMENLKQKSAGKMLAEGESPDLSILERALASVKDKGLREEALKVLANCKLGGERQVPIRPPSDTISVRETAAQTNIFGNLDRDCEEFIEVKEDVKGIKRIKKEQRNNSFISKSFNTILTSVEEKNTGSEYTEELDSMLAKFNLDMPGVQEVKQIREVLKTPIRSNEKINQIKTQLQKDLKMMTDYDENGLLGLHKVVMEDNSRAVRRLLMILKITKKNIDVKTLDGKTSLELSLKTDAGPDIVNALLEAGAKPTSEETGHDSALIIASKNSSPLLPELVKFAKGKGLDSMDSEGFAAIHHCALRGNIIGINALVRVGADINLQDCRSGRTALFHAIENQHPETARVILASGASPTIRNHDGQTILPLLDDVKNQTLKPIVYKQMKW